jgi:putative ABC transport system ATP-binding protein
MQLLKTEKISKTYNNSLNALSEVSFTLDKGEFTAISGRSGSGKSTLMNILGCLDRPTSGSIYVNSEVVDYSNTGKLVHLRRTVFGFIFQQFNLIPNLTAKENIEYPLLFNYHDKKSRSERSTVLLERVGLSDRAKHYPSELSGGEQQRVAIARALINTPLIVLADEPTGNLDLRTGQEILRLMREINRTQNTTFLLVTHDKDCASYTDRVITLADGKMVSDEYRENINNEYSFSREPDGDA